MLQLLCQRQRKEAATPDAIFQLVQRVRQRGAQAVGAPGQDQHLGANVRKLLHHHLHGLLLLFTPAHIPQVQIRLGLATYGILYKARSRFRWKMEPARQLNASQFHKLHACELD